MIGMTKKEETIQRALGLKADPFVAGILYAIQQLVLFPNTFDSRMDAKSILNESGIAKEEFIEAQRINAYRDDIMLSFFEEAFKEGGDLYAD